MYLVGILILSITLPFLFKQTIRDDLYKQTHKLSSQSTVIPSGDPPKLVKFLKIVFLYILFLFKKIYI